MDLYRARKTAITTRIACQTKIFSPYFLYSGSLPSTEANAVSERMHCQIISLSKGLPPIALAVFSRKWIEGERHDQC